MPLFEYKCNYEDCGREFEDLSKSDEKDNPRSCPSCGKNDKIMRKVSSFGINTEVKAGEGTLVSPKEIDKAIGAAASKSWESHNNRQKIRIDDLGKDIKEVVINKDSDGVVKPFKYLGTPKEQEFRKNYGEEYKEQITKKGKNEDNTSVVMKVDNTLIKK